MEINVRNISKENLIQIDRGGYEVQFVYGDEPGCGADLTHGHLQLHLADEPRLDLHRQPEVPQSILLQGQIL